MELKDIKTVYFDFDGTIHNSIKIYAPAFRKGYDFLVENKKAEHRIWHDEEIQKWLGYTSKEMWENFIKDLEEPYKKMSSAIIGKEMQNQFQLGNAKLYKNSLTVLEKLKIKGYKLIFLSNCSIKYMEASKELFNLNLYFDDMICSEMYDFIPKHEVLKIIKDNYEMNQVIVGDRFHDIDSAIKNGIQSIYCDYGYGDKIEGLMADVNIKSITEILNIL